MDPVTASALVAGGSALLGFGGQERANRINQREARLNRQFAAGEAATNRTFQERMRNTEWQSAVADMQAAGINPAVAYSRGGASSPGGSMASGSMPAGAVDSIAAGRSSAMEVVAMRKQMELLDSQIAKTRAESQSAAADASIKFRDQQMANQKYDFYFGPDGRPKGPLLELLQSEHVSQVANSARSVSEAQLAGLSVPERQAIARVFETVGGGGKAVQMLMPILLQMIRR